MCRGDYSTGYGFTIGFIHHLCTPLGTTSNYSAIANLHNSQIITPPTKPFPTCCFFTSRSLTTACNSGDSSASRAQVLSSQPPVCMSYNRALVVVRHPPSNIATATATAFSLLLAIILPTPNPEARSKDM
jgi:hypothetical protein